MASIHPQLQQLSEELHTALAPVLLNHNSNPLLYLCSHFRDRAGFNYNSVSAAYRTLRLTSSEGRYHENNIMTAYRCLAVDQGHVPTDQFLQLLSMLTDELPTALASALTEIFSALSRLPPNFITFHDATKACMVLGELTNTAKQGDSGHLFQLAEAKGLLECLLRQKEWYAQGREQIFWRIVPHIVLQLLDLQPMEQIRCLRAVRLCQQPGSGEALLDAKLQNEAVSQQVEQIMVLALSAQGG